VSAFSSPVATVVALLTVVVVVGLVAWALSLMQAANDRQEFSLMLAGCMVCSAAVGLSTVMVLTFASSNRSVAAGIEAGFSGGAFPGGAEGISLDTIALPWATSLDCLVDPARCPALPSS
jgi:uncharacterized membrane protein